MTSYIISNDIQENEKKNDSEVKLHLIVHIFYNLSICHKRAYGLKPWLSWMYTIIMGCNIEY